MKFRIIQLIILSIFFSCDNKEEMLSSARSIESFYVESQVESPIINNGGRTVHLTVLAGTNISNLKPVIEVSKKASLYPASGATNDFDLNTTYTVTSESGSSVDWTVFVEVEIQVEQVEIDGTNVEYTSIGNGPVTFVLIHNNDLDFDYWIESTVFRKLGKENQVIAYNRSGYGNSEINSNARTLSAINSELKDLISKVSQNEKIILLGHGFGGAVAQSFASEYPEQVEGLVLLDTSSEYFYTYLTEELVDDSADGIKNQGAVLELEAALNDLAYFQSISLPDIPTILLSNSNIPTHEIEKPYLEDIGSAISDSNLERLYLDLTGDLIEDNSDVVISTSLSVID